MSVAPTKALSQPVQPEPLSPQALTHAVAVGLALAESDPSRAEPSIRLILEAVSVRFAVRRVDLISARRTAPIARPRQIAMWLARTHTRRSLPEIGQMMGGRDHTTILHGVARIQWHVDRGDREIVQPIREIEAALGVRAVMIGGATVGSRYPDIEPHAVAARVLDHPNAVVSADEIRALAGFVRSAVLPIVDYDDPVVPLPPGATLGPSAGTLPALVARTPPPDPAPVRTAAAAVVAAHRTAEQAVYTAQERHALIHLRAAILALGRTLDTTGGKS
jgi:hypothetical protein